MDAYIPVNFLVFVIGPVDYTHTDTRTHTHTHLTREEREEKRPTGYKMIKYLRVRYFIR